VADLHDVVAALVDHADDLDDDHALVALNLERQWQRRDMDPEQWHTIALDVLRDHLFGDLEDPETDPELGEPCP
jgi:hypothetical protein